MIDPVRSRIWAYRILFALVILTLAAMRMLPLGLSAGRLPGPDLMVCFAFAWVLRRPAYVPPGLIVALFLPLDLILQQPPGLWALLVLLASEFLRAHPELSRGQPLPIEWAAVGAVIMLMVAGNHIALFLTGADRPPLGLSLLRGLFTAAVYPIVVMASQMVFNVRKPTPGEIDALGRRL